MKMLLSIVCWKETWCAICCIEMLFMFFLLLVCRYLSKESFRIMIIGKSLAYALWCARFICIWQQKSVDTNLNENKENEIKLSAIILMNISISNKNFSLLLWFENWDCVALKTHSYFDWYSLISIVELLC